MTKNAKKSGKEIVIGHLSGKHISLDSIQINSEHMPNKNKNTNKIDAFMLNQNHLVTRIK